MDPHDPRWRPETDPPSLTPEAAQILRVDSRGVRSLYDQAEEESLTREQFSAACRVILHYLDRLLQETPWYRRGVTVIRALRELLRILSEAREEWREAQG